MKAIKISGLCKQFKDKGLSKVDALIDLNLHVSVVEVINFLGPNYKRAGDLTGSELHFSLADRYMQESGQTELAIAYLTAMEKVRRTRP